MCVSGSKILCISYTEIDKQLILFEKEKKAIKNLKKKWLIDSVIKSYGAVNQLRLKTWTIFNSS